MNIEYWRILDFIDYPNYAISNLGNVKSFNYMNSDKEQILKPIKNKDGYLVVNLMKNGKVKQFRVHRLVAMAFIQNTDNLPQVNHIDEDKTNNCVQNLEWCSAKYNTNFGSCIKRRAEKHSKPVNQYTKDGLLIGSYDSAREAQLKTGIAFQHISKCCRGERKSAYGFIWRFR